MNGSGIFYAHSFLFYLEQKGEMKMKTFALKGNIITSKTKDELLIQENGYVICDNGISKGIFTTIPDEYKGIEIRDMGERLIIPGLVDLHLHAPQYTFRSMGMDMELLDWLNTYTFKEESKYADLGYAKKAYTIFVDDLKKGATTRACIFGTLHVPATLMLMELLEESGLICYVGKVNMNRNSIDSLLEVSAEQYLLDTKEWLRECKKFELTKPILTPRFIPSCTDDLMRGLAEIQKETGLPAQSHLSENRSEIEWVKELCNDAKSYGEAYDNREMFGTYGKTIMAHCVHSDEEERKLMRERNVFIAHCPQSNTNLSSGIAPVRTFLEEGNFVGLGTDVAGGHNLSLFQTMAEAIQVSKLRYCLIEEDKKPLTIEEAFYLGTKGGGAFFGKVGSLEEGYEFDAVVLDDTNLPHPQELTIRNRLERMIYLSDDRNIYAKYVKGNQISL